MAAASSIGRWCTNAPPNDGPRMVLSLTPSGRPVRNSGLLATAEDPSALADAPAQAVASDGAHTDLILATLTVCLVATFGIVLHILSGVRYCSIRWETGWPKLQRTPEDGCAEPQRRCAERCSASCSSVPATAATSRAAWLPDLAKPGGSTP